MEQKTMTGIYALPEKPSAADIIERSIIAHPSLFRDALIAQANMHADYVELSHNERAKQGARASKNACLIAYDTVGDEDQTERERAESICANTGTAVISLNVACKLQCIPPHIRTAAAVMLDGRN